MQINLAIDVMSGDLGPRSNLAGALLALIEDPQLNLTLVGTSSQIKQLLNQHHLSAEFAPRIKIQHSETTIGMAENPISALRRYKTSSMHLAVQLVAQGHCQGAVSGGNTGALMLVGRHYLGMLPGISRPAICTAIPTYQQPSYFLDLGANTNCTAKQLVEFALMGNILVQNLANKAKPKVGLLNVGEEAIKGTALVKATHELLLEHRQLNYLGYVEGNQIFSGDYDLLVTDGFTGNLVLKTSEGLAKYLTDQVQNLFLTNNYSKLVGWLAKPLLKQLKQQLDPVRYNGASFLGLQKCLVKSHGNADAQGFAFAIARAAIETRQELSQKLAAGLANP